MAKEVSRLPRITKARFRFQANPGANLAGKVALKFFFFSSTEKQASRSALGPTQPPIRSATKVLSLGLKQLVRKTDHVPASSVNVKNTWSYNSVSPVCLQLYLYHSWVIKYYLDALQDSLRTPVIFCR